jgi:putative peptidoglycan lipid II flippase
VFTSWLDRSREEARRVLGATWTVAGLVALAITLVGILLADPLVRLFAPGFALEPEKHELCVRLLRLCFPYILLLALVAVAMGALNALGHFLMPALAPVLLNLSLIAGAFAGTAWLDPPILGLGVAVIVAGALQVLVQVPPLRRRGFAVGPRLEIGHPAVRRLLAVMTPAVIGASLFQINALVSRFLSSFLGDGAVSYLYYADRLLELPLGVFVFALGSASLPAFSRLASSGDGPGLRDAFTGTLGLALALALPSTAGLILLREEIFRTLFSWNASLFGEEAVRGCAEALLFYTLGLVPITVSRICVGLCFAHENARSPANATVVGVVVHLFAALMLIGALPEGGLPDPILRAQRSLAIANLGYAGLAAAASLASVFNAVYLLAVVARRYGTLLGRALSVRLLKLLAATAALWIAVEISRGLLPPAAGGSVRGALLLAGHVGVGLLAYLAALGALRSPELQAIRLLLSRAETR